MERNRIFGKPEKKGIAHHLCRYAKRYVSLHCSLSESNKNKGCFLVCIW